MPFRHSCFISYQSGQNAMMERLINELYEALEIELALYAFGFQKIVYVDRERLQGGDFWNEALARALCESVCMIVIYTQAYFSKTHLYCVREYMGMEIIEANRLQSLGDKAENRGLIIPIVLRSPQYLPMTVKDRRQCYDFGKFSMSTKRISRHPQFGPCVTKISEYIYEFYEKFNNLKVDVCSHCTSFSLPTRAESEAWLDNMFGSPPPPPPPPWREGNAV